MLIEIDIILEASILTSRYNAQVLRTLLINQRKDKNIHNYPSSHSSWVNSTPHPPLGAACLRVFPLSEVLFSTCAQESQRSRFSTDVLVRWFSAVNGGSGC
jgi:hypothetical protein